VTRIDNNRFAKHTRAMPIRVERSGRMRGRVYIVGSRSQH
jgi:hypothetical protein